MRREETRVVLKQNVACKEVLVAHEQSAATRRHRAFRAIASFHVEPMKSAFTKHRRKKIKLCKW